ncbi:hypothetical protein [Roseibium sp.]|uniref:hypothetical protein n=1 Tax=Roseibium sp. TaxID=1936156 RepID=UPI003A96B650
MEAQFLTLAVDRQIISQAQKQALLQLVEEHSLSEDGFRLDYTNIFWVGGAGVILAGLVALSIETAAISRTWLSILVLGYGLAFLSVSYWLTRTGRPALLSSILATAFALCCTLAFITLQTTFDGVKYFIDYPRKFTPPREGEILPYNADLLTWFFETAAGPGLILALTGLYVFRKHKFLPSWVLIIAGLFAFTQELSVRWYYDPHGYSEVTKWHMISFGLLLYGIAWYEDLFAEANHGFWLNKLGMLSASSGLAMLFSDGDDTVRWLFLAISLTAIALSVFLRRPSGIGFGAVGIITVIFWRFGVQDNDLTLAFQLTVVGIFVLLLGYLVQRHTDRLAEYFPETLMRVRPDPRQDPVTFGY